MKKLSHSHPFTAFKASYTSCQWKSTTHFANARDTMMMMMMLNEALLVESALIPLQTVQMARCGLSVCFCEPMMSYVSEKHLFNVSDVLTRTALIPKRLNCHIIPNISSNVQTCKICHLCRCVSSMNRLVSFLTHECMFDVIVLIRDWTPYSWPEHIYNYLSHY